MGNEDFSVGLAIDDFQKGVRTYSENFSTILDYHASDDEFDADEYIMAFDEMEKAEDLDPVNQLHKKLDELDSKVDLVLASGEDAGSVDNYEDDPDFDDMDDPLDSEDYAEFEEELNEDLADEAFSDFIGNFDQLEYDEETGMVFGEFEGDTFVFNDDEEMVYVLNQETNQLEPFAEYSEFSIDEEDLEAEAI